MQSSVFLQVHLVVRVQVATLEIISVLQDLIELIVVVGRVKVVSAHQVSMVMSVVDVHKYILENQKKIHCE
jgi:hypothetical protein